MTEKDTALDKTDESILALLWDNSRLSLKEIGEQVHLSAPAVKSRLERLTDLGVVQQYTVKLDCPVYGYKIHVVIEYHVQLNGQKRFIDFIQDNTFHLEKCYHITGKQAFLIDGYFRHDEELQRFLAEIGQYGTYDIQMVLNDIPLNKLQANG